jgi:hypothetical protein
MRRIMAAERAKRQEGQWACTCRYSRFYGLCPRGCRERSRFQRKSPAPASQEGAPRGSAPFFEQLPRCRSAKTRPPPKKGPRWPKRGRCLARAPTLGKVSSRGAVPLPMSRIDLPLPPSTNVLCRSNRGRSTMYTDWQPARHSCPQMQSTGALSQAEGGRCRSGGEVACKIGSNFGPGRIEGVTNCLQGIWSKRCPIYELFGVALPARSASRL